MNLINKLFKNKKMRRMVSFSRRDLDTALKIAQKVGAKSCSYEGARGMMQVEHVRRHGKCLAKRRCGAGH